MQHIMLNFLKVSSDPVVNSSRSNLYNTKSHRNMEVVNLHLLVKVCLNNAQPYHYNLQRNSVKVKKFDYK